MAEPDPFYIMKCVVAHDPAKAAALGNRPYRDLASMIAYDKMAQMVAPKAATDQSGGGRLQFFTK